jgi:hypothetical protein
VDASVQEQVEVGPACELPAKAGKAAERISLTQGCCVDETIEGEVVQLTMHRRARAARAGVGLVQLALGGALASRKLPGGVALWPTALIPTWFGISHLIAAVIGYRGCPELGAIPTVMLGRPVGTLCEFWDRLDRRLVPANRQQACTER